MFSRSISLGRTPAGWLSPGTPVVAITGSTGKTSTKELVWAALAPRYTVHATAGNLNNEIGVPLTLLAIPPQAGAVVVEAGASVPGEIARLRDVIEPTIGVITNVGYAHVEGFGSLAGVEVSDVEATLPRPSFTERTLECILRERPDARLRFVMGSDALADTDKWHDYARVVELAPPVVLARRGHERPELGPAVLPDVSSTRVRELFSRGASDREARRELEALVPARVIGYVDEHALCR